MPASRAAVPGASTVLVAVLVAGPAVADGVVRGPNRIACPRVVMGIVRSAVDSVPVGVVVCRGSVSIATAEGWRCAAGGPSAANVVPALPPPATAGGESSCHGGFPPRAFRPVREVLRRRLATAGHFRRHRARGPVVHRDPRSASCVVYGRSRTNLHQRHRMSPRRTVHVYVTTAPVECVLSRVRAAPRGRRDRLTGSSVPFPAVPGPASLVRCPAGM